METKKIFKHSTIILIPLAVLSALIEYKKLPAGILVGGILGLANIKGLVWGVESLYGKRKLSMPMVFFSFLRLFLFFVIVAMLAYLKLVNIFGILIGFTVTFTMLIVHGLRYAKSQVE